MFHVYDNKNPKMASWWLQQILLQRAQGLASIFISVTLADTTHLAGCFNHRNDDAVV